MRRSCEEVRGALACERIDASVRRGKANQDVVNVQKYSNVQKVRYNNLFVLIGELREKDSRVRIKTPGAWHEVQDSR